MVDDLVAAGRKWTRRPASGWSGASLFVPRLHAGSPGDDERARLTLARAEQQDGTTHLVMSPLEFMQRLAALVPRPQLQLIRWLCPHNFASRSERTPAARTTACWPRTKSFGLLAVHGVLNTGARRLVFVSVVSPALSEYEPL